MPTYSNAHEKEEMRHMNSGLWRTFYALLLCWVPVLGLVLAISAFMTQAVRMTEKHKKRLFVGTTLAIFMVIVCLTVLLGEIYMYTQKPDVLAEWKDKVWGLVATDDQQDEYGVADEEDYGGLGLYDDGTSDTDYDYTNDTNGENDEDFSVPDEYYGEDDDGFYYDPADEYTGDTGDEDTGDEDTGDTDDGYDYDYDEDDTDDGLSTEAPDQEVQQAIYDDYKAGASAFTP